MSFVEFEQPLSKHFLVIDGSNLLYRMVYVDRSKNFKHPNRLLERLTGEQQTSLNVDSPEFIRQAAIHGFFESLNATKQKHGADDVIVCFDTGKSWRHKHTTSGTSLTKNVYKGNRRVDMTPKDEESFEIFKATAKEVIEILDNHTGIKCIHQPSLEADDIIAGLTQFYKEHTYTIISADGDLTQLIADHVRVYDIHNKKYRECEDVNYFLFLKCIRGDKGDNVMSAFPRVRETKIKQAYTDDYHRVNLMETVWKDENDIEWKVGDVFKENQLLMDLTKQPEEVRDLIKTTIDEKLLQSKFMRKFEIVKELNTRGLPSVGDIVSSATWLCGT